MLIFTVALWTNDKTVCVLSSHERILYSNVLSRLYFRIACFPLYGSFLHEILGYGTNVPCRIFFYPLMKRITNMPQVWLGITVRNYLVSFVYF